jgi:hypothetical protein
MSKLKSRWVLLSLAAVVSIAAMLGQAITGTLTGTVLDNSQAVIPNVTVVVKNDQSGDTRRTVTNQDGYFTVAALPAGSYTVTVETSGFKKYESTGVTFTGAEKRNLNIVLEVGTATEQVTVSAAASTITPVDSGEKSTVITTQMLQDISVVGRSAAEFIKIMPGMAQTGSGVENKAGYNGEVIGINGNGEGGKQSALGNFAANGTRPESMDITADGSHVSDPGCNCATPVNPNTDMIQEFKVLTSNFSAENSKGPIVLNSISKSGGKDFHGTGYLYARHYSMNSNEWLLNKTGQDKPHNKYFFPGGNIGGPVLIPGTNFNKNRDKLFFFTGYEYYAQTLDTGVLRAFVPTDQMMAGNFSPAYLATLGSKVPSGVNSAINNDQFPGGMVPLSQMDPGGVALAKLYPKGNVNPAAEGDGFNYVKALDVDQNSYQWLSRVDYSVSDNTKLFVRYNLQNELQQFPVGLWWRNPQQVPYPSNVSAKNQSQSISASLTNVLSPTLTNEFVAGYTYIDFPNTFDDPQKVSRAAVGYPYKGLYKNGLDQIPQVTSWASSVATMLNPSGFELGPGGNNLFAVKHLPSFSDNVSKVWGTHTLKFGMYYEKIINNQPSNNNSNDQLVFANWGSNSSGNGYSDLLLGRVAQYSGNNYNILHNEGLNILEFFAQDSWKVNRRLTLEYGIRFQHLGNWYDRQGIGFAIFDPAAYSNDPKLLGTFTGLKWNKQNPEVPLSGFPSPALQYSPRFGFAYDVFGNGNTVLRGGVGVFRYPNPQFTDPLDPAAGVRGYCANSCNGVTLQEVETIQPQLTRTSITVADVNDNKFPVTYSYSFTISQRLPGKSLFEIAYVGNKSDNLLNNGLGNFDVIPYGTLLKYPDPNNVDVDSLRKYQNYQGITLRQHNVYQNYNGLQTSWNRQSGRSVFTVNYTWSKALGIRGGGQGNTANQIDVRQNYGPLAYDRSHIFNAAYSYDFPQWFKGNKVIGGMVNGWQISGITQIQSGVNLQAAGNANFNVSGQLPDGGALNNKTIAGTPDVNLQPQVICDPRSNLGDGQFINGNCFALPTPGHNGDYLFPYIKGPAFVNSDISLFKNFAMGENRKLQFRASAFNFLNHPLRSFTNGDPNFSLNFGPDGKLQNDRFGFADTKFGRRVIQLAIKYYF